MRMPVIFKRFSRDKKSYKELQQHSVILTSELRSALTRIQASTDITTNTDSSDYRTYVGTPTKYNSYIKQVNELGKLYENTADWGCMVTRNIIDLRTAFSVGQGLEVVKRDGFTGSAEAEIKWVVDFMQFNNLDEELPQEYAKEAEIEGKILLRFLGDPISKTVRVIHVPWRTFNYEITTPANDFFNYVNAKYIGSGEPGVAFDLPPGMFIYKRFGGSASKVNETPPKAAFVLREIEDLDKALWDWRKINRIFTAPTPVITCPDQQTAERVDKWITSSNWRIGKMLILGGENISYELVGWTGDGYTTIKEETQALVKTISGTTGIPVHFFGYPELLSNRDTAENLIELIILSTTKERNTWIGAYEELFQKALNFSNVFFGTTFNPLAVTAQIIEREPKEDLETEDETVPNSQNPGAQSE